MRKQILKIAMAHLGSAVVLGLLACGNTNAEGVPTSLSSHEEMVCNEAYENALKQPKQRVDKLKAEGLSRDKICSCIKNEMENVDNFFDGRWQKLDPDYYLPVYQAAKKYKPSDWDDKTTMHYLEMTKAFAIASMNCRPRLAEEITKIPKKQPPVGPDFSHMFKDQVRRPDVSHLAPRKESESEHINKACELGVAKNCFELAVMYADGNGVKQNNQQAIAYFGEACDLKSKKGCESLSRLKTEKQ